MEILRNNTRHLLWILCVGILYTIGTEHQNVEWFCLGAILFVGIPHGAADHIISQRINPKISNTRYIATYVATAVGVLVWWLIMPLKAGFVFVVLSAFHFGQEMLEEYGLAKSSLFEKMSFGSVCIALPLVYYYQDILSPLSLSESGTYLSFIDWIRWPLILGILLSTVLILLFRRKQGTLSIEQFLKIVLGLSQILIGYYFLGFTAGFTVYFLIHHTTNSFNHQYKWLKKKIENYSYYRFLTDLVPLSLISTIGLGITLWFFDPETFEAAFFIALVVISAVTVPHTILFDKMYESNREK
jgi:Brp/Blh family beta-carotene 15,15'-monooxygenase